MRGAVKGRKIALEQAAAAAWWGSYFDRENRLAPFGKYLKKMRGGGLNRAAEIASAFKAMEKSGLNVKVRKIPKG
ncbi:hypothetical protein [Sphingopyxis macrogoltabida]|uniref:Uncharacterized protein n=1 Tax=Sphingopyxis macrogoltabida TaxID=33050 RepID=A0AAC9AVM9_SPHMC|nr:hypothetical protein [Sphingopyxis macrogoltabida]ALJ14124.1 hypothetical protein LH19_14720 [Sphingopyxis macrogoltabida]AMU90391.1 hypothetical protein ATM17_15300 [Sphingopyxis macrogoltabida]